jgi:hypothetical protein
MTHTAAVLSFNFISIEIILVIVETHKEEMIDSVNEHLFYCDVNEPRKALSVKHLL